MAFFYLFVCSFQCLNGKTGLIFLFMLHSESLRFDETCRHPVVGDDVGFSGWVGYAVCRGVELSGLKF